MSKPGLMASAIQEDLSDAFACFELAPLKEELNSWTQGTPKDLDRFFFFAETSVITHHKRSASARVNNSFPLTLIQP